MNQNELNKYEFEMLSGTDLMIDMVHNRIVITTDTLEDFDQAYLALCESTFEGMFYLRHIKEGVDHVYFTKSEDRIRFVDKINNSQPES